MQMPTRNQQKKVNQVLTLCNIINLVYHLEAIIRVCLVQFKIMKQANKDHLETLFQGLQLFPTQKFFWM